MTKEKLLGYLIVILDTLDECGWAPEGHIAVGLGMGAAGCPGIQEIQAMFGIGERAGLWIRSGHTLTITDKGRADAKRLREKMANDSQE